MNIPNITIDGDGYPTDEFIKWIENYDTIKNDPFIFIQIILDNWYHGDHGWKIQRKYRGEWKVLISTCGWSGNEDMMMALKGNFVFWMSHYFSHQRGGHYIFKFRKFIS